MNVLRTFLAESEGRQGSSIQDTFSSSLDVSEGGVGLQLTVQNFDSIPVVLAEENDRQCNNMLFECSVIFVLL